MKWKKDADARVIVVLSIICVLAALGVYFASYSVRNINENILIGQFTDDLSATTDYFFTNPIKCAVISLNDKKIFVVSQGVGFDLYGYKDSDLMYIGSFSDGDTLYFSSEGAVIADYDGSRHIRCRMLLHDDLRVELLETAELRESACYKNVTSTLNGYFGQKVMSEAEGESIDTSSLFNWDGESMPIEYFDNMNNAMQELHYDKMKPYTGASYRL